MYEKFKEGTSKNIFACRLFLSAARKTLTGNEIGAD